MYSSNFLFKRSRSRTTLSSSILILSELFASCLLLTSRSCLCSILFERQFCAYPLFFRVLLFCFSLTTSSLGHPCSLLLSSLTLRVTSTCSSFTMVGDSCFVEGGRPDTTLPQCLMFRSSGSAYSMLSQPPSPNLLGSLPRSHCPRKSKAWSW